MAYSVAVRFDYRPGCAECVAEGNRLASSALTDRSVTSITLAATKKCEHEPASAAPPPLRAGSAPALRAGPSLELQFPVVDPKTGLPLSDTNGSDPEDVMNGFDPKGRG